MNPFSRNTASKRRCAVAVVADGLAEHVGVKEAEPAEGWAVWEGGVRD